MSAGWRRQWWLAAAGVVLFGAGLVVAGRDPLPRSEIDLTDVINGAPNWLARVLWPIMQLGTIGAALGVGLVTWLLGHHRTAIRVVVSGVATWLLAKGVKEIVTRGRPLQYITEIDVREGSGTGLGFVSGHTAVAFSIATALGTILPLWAKVLAYAVAAVTGVARIVYGVHFPADVVGGAGLGILTADAVETVDRLRQRRSGRRKDRRVEPSRSGSRSHG